MKIWSDLSMLIKLVVVCLIIGFALGLCSAGALLNWSPDRPIPKPSVMAHYTEALAAPDAPA
ncbi:hypothetical protein AB0M20_15530 [Actinoplanes sp. NPDC051633]|uniref:hypothetical protein n=1 Tax=Actinoplanes sp. NPDC051633 TaxID=3155670 RepID=UPI0034402ADC